MSRTKAAVIVGSAVLSLAAMVAAPFAQPSGASPAAVAAQPEPTDAPRMGTWGFDLSGRDLSVRPGVDFNRYANGGYHDRLQIPPDRSRYGVFDQLAALSEVRTRAILERSAANTAATGDEARIGAFWRSFMDEGRIERLDARPLAADLAAVRAANTRERLAALMGRVNLGYNNSFFELYIDVDRRSPDRYAVYLGQAGLGMPDRDYYLQPQFAEQKRKYRDYVAQMLTMIRWPDAQRQADAIVALETQIAEASWSRAESREADRTYNPQTRAELGAGSPGFAWAAFLDAANLRGVDRVVLTENTAIPRIAAVFNSTPVATLQAWQAFNVADNAAPYLSSRFVNAHFEFRSRTLSGQPELRPRWKRAVNTINAQVGESVGRIYVDAYFPARSKAMMEQLVGDLRRAMAARIQRLSWMSPATRERALEKLSTFRVKIGYPNRWRDYSALTVTDQDLYGNVARSVAFDWNFRVARLNGPVDREEWLMNPQTVNAYYYPPGNEIVFPAAILQPPFFDPDADPAVNYGAIGGVIGHEIMHGFDDQGRKYDARGALTDWWAPEDATRFQEQTRRLGAQYAAYEPLSGMHINPDLTMGENVADLGGILLGLDAYRLHLNGREAPVLDGYTGTQRVFLGWAQVWRSGIRDDMLRRLLVSDPHSPERFRVIGPLRNVDEWYEAFDVQPTDPLYIPPDQRVRIW